MRAKRVHGSLTNFPFDLPIGRQLFERDHSLAKSDSAFVEDGDVDVDIALFERELNISDDEDDNENDVLRNIRSSD